MKMLFMLFFTSSVDQYIIDEHHDKLVQILHENLVHQIHEVGGALVNPNGITIYSYRPYLNMNAVFGMSHSRIFS
jgi:hypothetical protein